MFGKLFKGLRGAGAEAPSSLPMVADITIGRTVLIDRLALDLLPDTLVFELDQPVLPITAQGLIDLTSDADHAWVHRFYTDEDVMLQIMSVDRAGETIREISLFVPLKSYFPSDDVAWRSWASRLSAETFTTDEGVRFERAWFDDQPGPAEPVCFWEEITDDRQMTETRRIYQRSMLFVRAIEDSEEFLLAITQEPEQGDHTAELMIGIPLSRTAITV